MATNLLWYVLAGFLLGFASSTLWEWFYFRKERLKLTDRRIQELEAKVREAEIEPDKATTPAFAPSVVPTVASVTAATRTSAWSDTGYRSPGVFLESEEYDNGNDAFVKSPELKSSEVKPAERAKPLPVNTSTVATTPPVTAPPTAVAPSNSFVPSTTSPVASMPPATPPSVAPADSTVVPRGDQPSPADALRAKRVVAHRTRQEVLAALRRNSEAVERGEQLPSESNPAKVGPGEDESRPSLFGTVEEMDDQKGAPLDERETPPQETPSADAQAPALSAARQRWFGKPELTQRSKEYPDDLSKIKGIGDVYKQRLYRAGFYTWKQIAETDSDTLRRATSAYPSSNVEEWHGQAEKLMEKFGRKDAVYSGPHPDDMTKILGIGPVGAAVLYRAGICTYEQLASTPIADLQALFPIAVAGDQPDFNQWVARSTALADDKHSDE